MRYFGRNGWQHGAHGAVVEYGFRGGAGRRRVRLRSGMGERGMEGVWRNCDVHVEVVDDGWNWDAWANGDGE
jgi:hypothetical protein